ncbi:hypothetical protein ACIQ6R_27250 [Streptomyces sp. NPDC096048]|uniref:hypothetical protein n=1 Tax=Streptomyces sp. NPDC096048 TaxID=3366072 RepID=UPI00381BA1C3
MSTTGIALVTGGNRGIGSSIVAALAAEGRDIVCTYDSHEAEGSDPLGINAQDLRSYA